MTKKEKAGDEIVADVGDGVTAVVGEIDQEAIDLAKALLLPNPAVLDATGEQLIIPVVNKPGPLEFFRTHPKTRLTLAMACPGKGDISAVTYAVMPAAVGPLERHKIEIFPATLYPIVIDSNPLIYKLVMVKLPRGSRGWDNYNLGKKLALDEAVTKWKALRSISGGYQAMDPDPEAVFPDAVFPGFSEGDWLMKSLAATDLIIHDESHPVFKLIRHL